MSTHAIPPFFAFVLASGLLSPIAARPMLAPEIRRPDHVSIHRAQLIDASKRIDINQISMVVTNTGSFAYDVLNGSAGLEYPKGTGKTAVFAAGLWLGALVNGQVRVAVSEYSDEYGPGAMVGGVADDPTQPKYKVYKLNRIYDDLSLRDADLLDYRIGAVPHGAPSVTVLGDGTLSIPGDQMLWCVFNDADPSKHTNGLGATAPLGVEIQLTAFAFTQTAPPGPADRTVFLRYKILNKDSNTLQDLHVGMWSDPDLGGFTDDLVGCDPSRHMGYVYNSDSVDELYGEAPPALGIDMLRGPVGAGGAALGMTAFSRYVSGAGPSNASGVLNELRGLEPGGTPVIDPTTGLPTPFWVPGDPATGFGWLDASPSDRRMLISSGPVTLLPGESQQVDYAIVVGQGPNRLSSILELLCDDDAIQALYDRSFAPPLPGEPPCAQVVNCPRPADYWYQQFAFGGGDFSPVQLAELAQRVDVASLYFDWAGDPMPRLIAALDPVAVTLTRSRALREYAALLCNIAVSWPPMLPISGPMVFLATATPVSCPGLTAQTIGGLAQTAVRGLSEASYLDVGPNPQALIGVDVGLPLFGGGAGYAADLFGSSIPSGAQGAHSVEVRFTGGATGQYAYRYLRTLDGGGNRVYQIQDYVSVPFVVWDLDDDRQLNAAFLENAGPPPAPNLNFAWDPDESAQGGREILWVMDSPYSGDATPDARYFNDPDLTDMLLGRVDVRYALWSRRIAAGAPIDSGDRFRFTWGGIVPGPGVDVELFHLSDLAPGDPAAALGYDQIADCLAAVNGGIGIGVTCAGPTPTLVSVVGSEVASDHVSVTWSVGGSTALQAQVERREDQGDPAVVGEVAADGRGLIVFEDRQVAPGHTYVYRLRWNDVNGLQWAGEISVEVPLRDRLSLGGFHPNPGGRIPQLAFTLASAEPATLTLYDVSGRRLRAIEVGALGPGPHLLPLEDGESLASGVYLLHLKQGRHELTRQAVAIR